MTTDVSAPRRASGSVDPSHRSLVRQFKDFLGTRLFPEAEVRSTLDAGFGLALLLVSGAIAFLRIPAAGRDTFWAEDGTVFYQASLSQSWYEGLVTPYAGYLHLFPRLTAEIAAALPVQAAAYALGALASLAIGVTSWAVWTCGRGLLPSPWLRGLLALGVALAPPTGLESVGNVANSHFFLLFAAFWALLGPRRTLGQQVAPSVLVVFAALSDPTTLVLLPLAVGRLIHADSWRERIVPVCYSLAMAVQLAVALSADRVTGGTPSLRDIAFGYSFRVVSPTLFGLDGTGFLVAAGGSRLIWAVAGCTAIALVAAMALFARQRMIVLASGLASVTYFVVSCLFAVAVQYPPTGAESLNLFPAARYTIVPILLLLTALLCLAQAVASAALARRPRLVPLVVAVAAAPLLGYAVTDFRPDPGLRASVVDWSRWVDEGQQLCLTSPDDRQLHAPIAPGGAWDVDLTCSDLAS